MQIFGHRCIERPSSCWRSASPIAAGGILTKGAGESCHGARQGASVHRCVEEEFANAQPRSKHWQTKGLRKSPAGKQRHSFGLRMWRSVEEAPADFRPCSERCQTKGIRNPSSDEKRDSHSLCAFADGITSASDTADDLEVCAVPRWEGLRAARCHSGQWWCC